jgi:hypothetical protein
MIPKMRPRNAVKIIASSTVDEPLSQARRLGFAFTIIAAFA